MKKFISSCILVATLFCFFPMVYSGGGDSFAGGLAGGMIGGVLTGAMTKDSGSSRRAEEEARRAQDQTSQLRREQITERQRQRDFKMNLMIFVLILLGIAVLALGYRLLKKNSRR